MDKAKTQLCKSYEYSGVCFYGKNCQFAHGKHELRRLKTIKYKLKACVSFETKGYCNYGSKCHFNHNQGKVGYLNFCVLNNTNKMRLPVFKNIVMYNENALENKVNGKSIWYSEAPCDGINLSPLYSFMRKNNYI